MRRFNILESLSEIIEEMISPYHDGDYDDINLLVAIAQMGWNKTVLPQKQ